MNDMILNVLACYLLVGIVFYVCRIPVIIKTITEMKTINDTPSWIALLIVVFGIGIAWPYWLYLELKGIHDGYTDE